MQCSMYGRQCSAFRVGLNRLTGLGLSLDGLVYHPQHADLVDLAHACPDANIK